MKETTESSQPLPSEPVSIWERMDTKTRKNLVWSLWFITWIGLLIGYIDTWGWTFVVIFSAAHAILFWWMLGRSVEPFPVQVRIAYFLWVAVGTYVPYMVVLMWITTVGLATNLFLGYCPLARMMTLLPWNRQETLSWNLVKRTFLSPPSEGRFTPPPNQETMPIVSS